LQRNIGDCCLRKRQEGYGVPIDNLLVHLSRLSKENAIPFSSSEPSTRESEAQEAIRTTVSKPISQGADGTGRNDGHGGLSILPESSQCPRHTRDHLLPEANVTEARLSHTGAGHTAPSSAGNVYDVFTHYENEFGRVQTIRDT
jgi:hypothetical protein